MRTSSVLWRAGRWAVLLGLGGCVESYMPDVVPGTTSLLVVDGFINGNGRTRIRLSRSVDLNVAAATPPVVRGAVVYIVDSRGLRYQAREVGTNYGLYVSDSLQLDPSRQYKLLLTVGTTATAPSYESELVPLKVTPPFDQAELVREGDQVRLLVSAHDATGQTRYYRWRCSETWEFNSAFTSVLEVRNGKVGPRTTPIYTCYRSETPSSIRQVSTAALGQDAVSQHGLLDLSGHDERYKIRYSVLVTQAAETAKEFAYNEILRKNTEAVGTVNDPLPSQLTGNVRRVNGNTPETVLGFVGAHTVVQRRLFATPASLGFASGWDFVAPYKCVLDTERVPDPRDKPSQQIHLPYTKLFNSGDNVPTNYYTVRNGNDTLGYMGALRGCVDCRTRGTTTKPVFW